MARTKAEIRAFLDSMVGGVPQHPAPYQDLSGQCVTGVKVLMDFLGVPNPYRARGNATSVDDALLAQGIADNGKGWLTIVVNHDMGYIDGQHYGHIWVDLMNEANYETNGRQALHTTKNTRPITQGQQFVNLDKWVKGDVDMALLDSSDANELFFAAFHRKPGGDEANQWIGKKTDQVAVSIINQPEWLTQNHFIAFFQQREQQLNDALNGLNDANAKLQAALDNDATDKKALAEAQKAAQDASDQLTKVTDQYAKSKADYDAAQAENAKADATGNAFLRWLGKILNGGK